MPAGAAEAGGAEASEPRPSQKSSAGVDADTVEAKQFPLMAGWQVSLPEDRTRSLCGRQFTLKSQQSETIERSRWIALPSDPMRAVWDMFGAFLIFYDLWAIPLQAFDPPGYTLIISMDWITLVYWTIDIPMTLQVGFVRDGQTVVNFRAVLMNYLKTWFAVDLVVVVPDWFVTLQNWTRGADDTVSGLKMLRVVRLVRLLRLIRLFRLGRIVQRFNDLIETERANIFVNIIKMIVLLTVITHYVACLWFLISRAEDGPNTWLKVHGFDEDWWRYQYMTAFHWAITQFTPASMHVQPQNLTERSFTVAIVIFGLVGFSYVVGSITGSLAQLRGLSEETSKQFWMMRRYLKQNRVPVDLSARVTRCLERAWEARRKTVQLKDSKIFDLLSEQLRSELRLEIWMPLLRRHVLFSDLADMQSRSLVRIAAIAMEPKIFAEGDHVFLEGKAEFTYIRVTGNLLYQKRDAPNLHVSQPTQIFIAEPVLWTPTWVHLGVLSTEEFAEMLMLDPKKFMKTIGESANALAAAVRYGGEFVRKLRLVDKADLSDIGEVEDKERPTGLLSRMTTQIMEF